MKGQTKANKIAVVIVALLFTTTWVCILSEVSASQVTPMRPPPTYSIYGYVKDANSQRPLVGATVSIQNGGGSSTTDTSGYYRISGLDLGNYYLYVSKSGFSTQGPTSITLSESSVRRDWSIERGNGLTGWVMNTNGNGLGGVTVSAWATNSQYGHSSVTTDQNGFYYVAPWYYGYLPITAIADKVGYWANYAPNAPNIVWSSPTSCDFYLRSSTYSTVILSATYVTWNGFNNQGISIPECAAFFGSGSTVTFGYQGSGPILGIGGTQTATVQSLFGENAPLPSTYTGEVVSGTVEISGVTQGRQGYSGYQELSTYVRPTIINPTAGRITTSDNMELNVSMPGILNATVRPNSPDASNMYDATGTVSTASNFNIGVTLNGSPLTITTTRSTTSSDYHEVGVGVNNPTNQYLHYYYYIEQPTTTDHALIMHVWFYSLNDSENNF